MSSNRVPSSFRDPSGFLFRRDGVLYRQVNAVYKDDYDKLMGSGLYEGLVSAGLMISHEECEARLGEEHAGAYKILKPEPLDFISYPYEWCFSQLRDAALLTLEIQKTALDFGMSLKDSSAYNIQFRNGKPVLIDTLSFETFREGEPWVAYRQFCQHFLAPLALMTYKDIRLSQLLRTYIDGIPLDLASSLLPFRARFRIPMLLHVCLHAKSQRHFADKPVRPRRKMSRWGILGLVDSLESAVRKLRGPRLKGSEWSDYYGETNYSPDAFQHKRELVAEFLSRVKPKRVWDLGANTGVFSRIAGGLGAKTVSFDIDPIAVEKNYLECVGEGEGNVLPLLLDLSNPTPPIGWANRERMSLLERGPVDAALALALIHHLAIANNVPLDRIAEFFSTICRCLIIEFVPKNDSQVERLLATREDIFSDYEIQAFEREFQRHFTITASEQIQGSGRTLYLMQKTET